MLCGLLTQRGRFLRRMKHYRCFSSAQEEKLFDKILVANRGEIACRVFQTCKRLGIKTVAVHSEADARSKHVMMADEAVCVGPPPSSESYLRQDRILEAIQSTGAQAIHPGYGFLSENSEFSRAVNEVGAEFIGPKEYAIIAMGDKIGSKKIAADAGVSTIPGFLGAVKTDADVVRIANECGYPIMVKASKGGGGKGMRVAWNDKEAIEGFRLSKQEALSSFGDDTILIEKFIEDPRHIEIQVICDRHGNAVYLNERECSIQRRNQKVIEEAPSVVLTPETRKAMGEQACALARAVQYESAGTVEMLVDKHQNFFFLEMNTRLQVEHPVSEYITGVDLVEQMIRVAAGLPLSVTQDDIGINGWAIESRVYAEDPLSNFLPSIGHLAKYEEPGHGDPNVRNDSGVRKGDNISIYYDPMICKLITYGKDRDEALAKMRTALDSYVIHGVKHNIGFLRSLCDHPRFVSGDITTKFIEEEYPDGYKGHELTVADKDTLVCAALVVHLAFLNSRAGVSGQASNFHRQAFVAKQMSELIVTLGEEQFSVATVLDADGLVAHVGGKELRVQSNFRKGDVVFDITLNGETPILQITAATDSSSTYSLQLKASPYTLSVRTPREQELYSIMPEPEVIDTSRMVVSPMPGAVFSVVVQVGDTVAPGAEVMVIEAMKMQNVLRAEQGGVVKSVNCAVGDTVSGGDVLVEFEE